jgi:hypothetical protein
MDKTEKLQEFRRAELNQETSQIAWRELQRYFASGATLSVGAAMDLVEVALQISQDNAAQVQQWLQEGHIAPVSDEQARTWYEADAVVWAVVVRPYVLVQAERKRVGPVVSPL